MTRFAFERFPTCGLLKHGLWGGENIHRDNLHSPRNNWGKASNTGLEQSSHMMCILLLQLGSYVGHCQPKLHSQQRCFFASLLEAEVGEGRSLWVEMDTSSLQ